jgi:hypothetical protein
MAGREDATSWGGSTRRSIHPERVTKQPRFRRLVAVGVTSLVGLASLACSSDGATLASPPPSTAVTAPASSSVPTTTVSKWTADEQAVVTTYETFVVATHEAAATNDPMLASFVASTTGVLLSTIRTTMAQRHASGLGSRPAVPTKSRGVVVSAAVNGDSAKVTACDVDDTVVYRLATGETVNDETATQRATARLERTDGVWKVAAHQPAGEELAGDEVDRCVAGF